MSGYNQVRSFCEENFTKLEKDPVGSKVLERNVCVSNSEIKAEKEQPDHEVTKFQFYKSHVFESRAGNSHCYIFPFEKNLNHI